MDVDEDGPTTTQEIASPPPARKETPPVIEVRLQVPFLGGMGASTRVGVLGVSVPYANAEAPRSRYAPRRGDGGRQGWTKKKSATPLRWSAQSSVDKS